MARMMSTDDQVSVKISVSVHCLIEFDTESLESTRANTKTNQRKKMVADSRSKTRAKPTNQAITVPGPSKQLPADMAEFKIMFVELKELREEARERDKERKKMPR